MTATATPPPLDVLDIDAGVIEEARRRQRRQWGIAAVAVLMAAAALAAVAVWLVGGGVGGSGQRSQSSGPPVRITFADDRFAANRMPIGIALALDPAKPGSAQAYFDYDGDTAIDNDVPGSGARVLVRWDAAPADPSTPGRIIFAIVGPGVAAVRDGNYGTFTAHHLDGLPPGYKAVVFYYSHWPSAASQYAPFPQGVQRSTHQLQQLPRSVPLTPLSATGAATAAPSTTN